MNTTQRLARDERNKMIGGVCAGLAAYFGVDVTLVRVAVVVLALTTHAFGLLGYGLLWAIMPPSTSVQG